MLYTYVSEDEDREAVGPSSPLELFSRAAVEVGLIRAGDPLDQNLVEYAKLVVHMCAAIGDNYLQPESPEETVGAHPGRPQSSVGFKAMLIKSKSSEGRRCALSVR